MGWTDNFIDLDSIILSQEGVVERVKTLHLVIGTNILTQRYGVTS